MQNIECDMCTTIGQFYCIIMKVYTMQFFKSRIIDINYDIKEETKSFRATDTLIDLI